MPVAPARQIAFEILRRVESEGAYASDLLHSDLGPHGGATLKAEDAALATELVMGVLRWQRLLDFLLERQIKKPLARLDLPVLLALRLGLYQLRYLQRVPQRAAVHESVELVKMARKTSAATLANAVLRRLAQDAKSPVETLLPESAPPAERLAISLSHPTWMVERWMARFGEARTGALLEANNRPPHLTCFLNDPSRKDRTLAELATAGLRIGPAQFLSSAFVVSGGSPALTDVFRAGEISIQDEASQSIPLLLDVQEGESVLDLCAAPGGKTSSLSRSAQASKTQSLVVAADLHLHRVRAMRAQFERLHLPGIHLIALDAANPLPFRLAFQKILVDAPCSGTGTLARHPEIRWRLRPQHLAELHRLQTAILTHAIAQLPPKGRLVYSTCSLEPEENEDVIVEALKMSPGVRLAPAIEAARALTPHLMPGVEPAQFFDSAGQFRTFPGESPVDGFFAAILEKP